MVQCSDLSKIKAPSEARVNTAGEIQSYDIQEANAEGKQGVDGLTLRRESSAPWKSCFARKKRGDSGMPTRCARLACSTLKIYRNRGRAGFAVHRSGSRFARRLLTSDRREHQHRRRHADDKQPPPAQRRDDEPREQYNTNAPLYAFRLMPCVYI